jgi:aromatic ring-cleaving dioxygenase
MQSQDAPFHAHVYYTPATREVAVALHSRLLSAMTADRSFGLIFVGQMRDYKVGPHPDPQFEVHFLDADLNKIVPVLKSSGLTVLVHPLTRDDFADHTTSAQWIGDPIPLDLTTLDPPGVNQGLARFGKTDV